MTNASALSATLTLVAAGAVTGLFFAFSVAVMPGLDAIDPERAVAAMQSINEKIVNPVFLAAFLGTPLAAAVTGGLLLATGHRAAGAAFLAAAGVYLLGALMPTFIVNVPMNDTLAAAGTPDDAAHAARLWADYSPRWTAWNTARGAFSALSLLLAALGAYLWGRNG
ncbi:anthrone oxygenase family protein [Streptomyces sp. 6N223]|uniref:anthrone oxygenase family protein n=1 Tax=Streptomyces sp. 6N223 TaxID=3457412 RepID=UPI003FCEED08